MVLLYGVIARAERAARRSRHSPLPAPVVADGAAGRRRASRPRAMQIVLRCPARVTPRSRGTFCRLLMRAAKTATFGRLEVGGWGANTMRAEFAVLTGIPENELGYDRFNPYHAFARVPIASLAWRLRSHGYRTICLHPFDRGFFRRDLTLPALGFETFLGIETLGGSRRPPVLLGSRARAACAQGARRGRPRSLYFCDHDGQSWPVARGRTADRPRAAAEFRPGRAAARRRAAALLGWAAPIGRNAPVS